MMIVVTKPKTFFKVASLVKRDFLVLVWMANTKAFIKNNDVTTIKLRTKRVELSMVL